MGNSCAATAGEVRVYGGGSNAWSGDGGVGLETREDIKGYTEFLQRRMEPEEFASKRNEIVELLYQFKNNV